MANTYSEITIQIIFAVKYREALIEDSFRKELHQYISGVVSNQGQKMLSLNSVADHIHILAGISPSMRISDLVREVKSESSHYINKNRYSANRFYWQNGYAAFSYSNSQRSKVISYIENQKKHHKRISFRQEYILFLELFEINYKNKYLFDFID